MRDWEAIIPEEERKVYEKAGYKGKEKFGINPVMTSMMISAGLMPNFSLPL